MKHCPNGYSSRSNSSSRNATNHLAIQERNVSGGRVGACCGQAYTASSQSHPSETGCTECRGCHHLLCKMEVLSMLKLSVNSDNVNPITKHFDIGKQVGSAGPEMVWKIFDAVRLEDKRVSLTFSFQRFFEFKH